MFKTVKKIFRNEVVIFIVGKYFAYSLQFLNAIIIAQILGAYYFGIYSFIMLFINYLKLLYPGVHYSVNVELSIRDRNIDSISSKVAYNGLLINTWFSAFIFLTALTLVILNVDLFPKYDFSNYLLLATICSISLLFNLFFTNVFRSYSKFYEILISLILPQIFILTALLIAPFEKKIEFLFYAFFLGYLFSNIVFILRFPLNFSSKFDKEICNTLFFKGIKLALYNAGFYFILISSRTIVSIFYDVESLGLFSFANSIAQSSILFLNVITYVFFPKLLNRFKTEPNNPNPSELLIRIRELYLPFSYLLVFMVIVAYFILMQYMDNYIDSSLTFLMLILTQLMLAKAYGYAQLLIARGYEGKIAVYTVSTVFINVVLSLFFIFLFDYSFNIVALATLLSVFYYVITVNIQGKKIINNYKGIINLFYELFPKKYLIPLVFLLIERLFLGYWYTAFIPLSVLLIINMKTYYSLVISSIRILSNPNVVKF